MNEAKLRDQLLELEFTTPELEANYRQQMAGVLERRLTPFLRIAWGAMALMNTGLFVLFSAATFFLWGTEEFPLIGKLMFGAGALFCLGFAVLGTHLVIKGSANLRPWNNETLRQLQTVPPAVFGLVWVFCVLLVVATQLMGSQMEDVAKGNQMILGGITTMLLFGIPILILGLGTKSEIASRERFLQIELHLAELRELIASRPSAGGFEEDEPS